MRKYITIIASISSIAVAAQVINGSFEDGLNGWSYVAWDDWDIGPALTSDTPLDGGDAALELPTTSAQASLHNRAFQVVDSLVPGGTYRIGGWARPYFNAGLESPSISLCYNDITFSPVADTYSAVFLFTGEWVHEEVLFMLAPDLPPNTSFRFVVNSGQSWLGPTVATPFDNVFMELELSTTLARVDHSKYPAFRPNPATDKLWIDLPEAPLSITAIDGTGRSIPLHTFHHNGGSLEVDVSSVPPGLCVMQVNLISGMRTIRFIKA